MIGFYNDKLLITYINRYINRFIIFMPYKIYFILIYVIIICIRILYVTDFLALHRKTEIHIIRNIQIIPFYSPFLEWQSHKTSIKFLKSCLILFPTVLSSFLPFERMNIYCAILKAESVKSATKKSRT